MMKSGEMARLYERWFMQAVPPSNRPIGLPASAATLAGIRQLRAEGVIRPGERVVGVLTGHVLKDPGILQTMHQETEPPPVWANRPIRIAPEIEAVRRVLDAARSGEE